MSNAISPSLVKIGLKTKKFYHYAKFCQDPFLNCIDSRIAQIFSEFWTRIFGLELYNVYIIIENLIFSQGTMYKNPSDQTVPSTGSFYEWFFCQNMK